MSHRILIVEDDAPTRFVYNRVLASLGCEIYEASDCDQAIKLVKQLHPQVVILDMLLPGADGTKVLDVAYADPALSGTRFIIVTAHDGYRRLPLRRGDRVVVKPISAQQLRDITLESMSTSSAI